MRDLCRLIGWMVVDLIRSRVMLEAEIWTLRQQINVLRRTAPKKLSFCAVDRMIFVGLYRLFPKICDALAIVKPDTLVRWRRAGFRSYWRWKSRRRGGRPIVPVEIRRLIREMSIANPLWKSFLDGVVDTQSSECDAAGLAIVERTPPTGIARNVMLGACVADHQLASATPAADEAGEQSVAVLRRSVMPACGHVVAHHLADRLRPLPADVTLMDAWDRRQPFGSRLTTAPGSDHGCGCIISCRDTTLTIGVGAAVDRVLDHPA